MPRGMMIVREFTGLNNNRGQKLFSIHKISIFNSLQLESLMRMLS